MTSNHKLKAEWTKSSANEINVKQLQDKDEEASQRSEINKIKILDQIILCTSNDNENNVSEVFSDKQKKGELKTKKCQICEKSYSTNFEEHQKTHELFECSEIDCGKKFKRKSSLRKHTYFHKGKFKYSCEDCKETFIDKSKFEIHCASKHNKIERTYECKECSKTFSSPDYLRKHLVIHNDEFKYKCTMCSQKFKWLTSLQTHMQIHTQNKTIVNCKDCFKRFFNQRTLFRHMKIHQNLKFQCKVCNQVSSNRKDNIMRHIRHLHSDIPKSDILKNILTIDQKKGNDEMKDSSDKAIQEIEIDDDDDSNDLIIDETVRDDDEEVEVQEVIEVPIINNRVNVIQSIGNPNKNLNNLEEKPVEIKAVKETAKEQSICDNQIQLPPKKKAIAKYNPIEHYRKILGLSDTASSLESKECEQTEQQQQQQQQQVFPDHWRKRTSQNFLFRR